MYAIMYYNEVSVENEIITFIFAEKGPYNMTMWFVVHLIVTDTLALTTTRQHDPWLPWSRFTPTISCHTLIPILWALVCAMYSTTSSIIGISVRHLERVRNSCYCIEVLPRAIPFPNQSWTPASMRNYNDDMHKQGQNWSCRGLSARAMLRCS